MNLHEYQAKSILAEFGVSVQNGIVATNSDEALISAKSLTEKTGTKWYVVKAQIHAGGRGKGGGVKLAKSLDEVNSISKEILGMQLVTPQTPPEGKTVHQILIAEDVYYKGPSKTDEFYISVMLDRESACNMILYSTEGGVDIETVAEKTPHLIFKEKINPNYGLFPYQARNIAFNLGLSGKAFKDMIKFVSNLYYAYCESDASLFEINPVLKTSDNKIIAVDAKMTIDDNSLFRHSDYDKLRDIREENPTEIEAKALGLSYVSLNGNVGCMVNGAGLAMATMDIIKQAGGDPANFLDVGGTADSSRVEAAFRIILRDTNVKAILVNIFGGIVRCDRVANGIVDAFKKMDSKIKVPLVVRLQGTNSKIAKKIIDDSGLDVHSVTGFQEAAEKVQSLIHQ